jgi:hypothetical protein
VTFERLAKALEARPQGSVVLTVTGLRGKDAEALDAREAVDRLLKGSGLNDEGPNLEEVSEQRATFILQASLQFDLAYRAEVLAESNVATAVGDFLRLAGPGARYFTNRMTEDPPDPENELGYDRVSVSDATFDALVIAVGNQQAGLLCVLDED